VSVIGDIEDVLKGAASRHGPAVVGLGRGWGTGSGAVIAPGRVLASARALRHDEAVVTFADGSRGEGTVSGVDPDLGLAVIAVDTGEVEPLAWADPGAEPVAGQAVVALSNPGGRGLRVTFGFVSSAGRSFRGPRGRRIAGALEHTAALPRGSAGAPLLDLTGRVIAINSVRAEGGLILALPADAELQSRVQALARGEAPRRARLGVAVASPRATRELRRAVGLPEREGLLVRGVQEGSPAAEAGVRRGDLILALGGRETPRIDDLHEAMDAVVDGAPAELAIVRGTDELILTVEVS
jgi:serine protease Do